VLALIEGLVSDALEQLGVVRQALGVAPGDLVRAVAKVIVAERLSRVSIASISAFLETKAASASSLDLTIWFSDLGLIFVLPIGDFDNPMNAPRGRNSKQKRRSESGTYDLTSGHLYGCA
jgi:hypothetical protein